MIGSLVAAEGIGAVGAERSGVVELACFACVLGPFAGCLEEEMLSFFLLLLRVLGITGTHDL